VSSAASTIASWFARDLPARELAPLMAAPTAHVASGGVVNENITIPDVNYSIGALYRWSDHSTSVLTTCSHDALVSALSAKHRAGIAAVHGKRGVQIRVRRRPAADALLGDVEVHVPARVIREAERQLRAPTRADPECRHWREPLGG
jgi:hypothetical protein